MDYLNEYIMCIMIIILVYISDNVLVFMNEWIKILKRF